MSEWIDKCWGRTQELIDSPFYSKHKLELNTGGYCSIHYHVHRANRFIIISGSVEIIEFYGPRFTRHLLGPDNTYDIPSLVPHMFAVHKNGSMIEEYFPDRGGVVNRGDIIRLTEGGKVEISQLTNLPNDLLAKIDV